MEMHQPTLRWNLKSSFLTTLVLAAGVKKALICHIKISSGKAPRVPELTRYRTIRPLND